MWLQSVKTKRVVALCVLLGIAGWAASAAMAEHLGAFERAVPKIATQASPDAFERAVAAALRPLSPAPDVFERTVAAKVAAPAPPDAFVRGVESLRPERIARQAFERAERAGNAAHVPAPATTAGGFDWSDFGLGAGAGIGFALLLASLGIGLAAGRRGSRRVTSA